MKTIFISIYDGDTEKNILRSGILGQLKKEGHKVVLLIRAEKRLRYYKENFGDKNVEVVPLPNGSTRAEAIWHHVGWNSIPTYSVYLRRHDMYIVHKKKFRYAIECTLGFLGRFKIWRSLLRAVYYFIPDDYADDIFETYKPDIVFAPNMFSAEDSRLLKAAKKRGIKTITTVKSWDVLTTKAFTRVIADNILVFNSYNADEAVSLGDYRRDRVNITGFPQFDIYADSSVIESRTDFFNKIQVPENHKLILFAVPGDWKMAYTDEVVKHVDDAIEKNQIPGPATILARLHPKYPSKVESRTDYNHVRIDRPGTYFSVDKEKSLDTSMSQTLAWTFTDADIRHLANSLYHCDVLLNIESTMTLDIAAFDKPTILVGYDGDQKLPYLESIVRNYDRNHYQYVIKAGGTRVAHSKDELIEQINAYLQTPSLDAEGRASLRERLLYRVDGKSSERVASAILAGL